VAVEHDARPRPGGIELVFGVGVGLGFDERLLARLEREVVRRDDRLGGQLLQGEVSHANRLTRASAIRPGISMSRDLADALGLSASLNNGVFGMKGAAWSTKSRLRARSSSSTA